MVIVAALMLVLAGAPETQCEGKPFTLSKPAAAKPQATAKQEALPAKEPKAGRTASAKPHAKPGCSDPSHKHKD